MKKNVIALLFVSLFTFSLNAGLFDFVIAAAAGAGAITTGIKFMDERSKTQSFTERASASTEGLFAKFNNKLRSPAITTPAQQIEQELGETTKFLNRHGKTIGWGAATVTLAVISLHFALRK